MDQLEALGVGSFDIGVKRINGTVVLREGWASGFLLSVQVCFRISKRKFLLELFIEDRPDDHEESNRYDARP
jgi:hypothetical protein